MLDEDSSLFGEHLPERFRCLFIFLLTREGRSLLRGGPGMVVGDKDGPANHGPLVDNIEAEGVEGDHRLQLGDDALDDLLEGHLDTDPLGQLVDDLQLDIAPRGLIDLLFQLDIVRFF